MIKIDTYLEEATEHMLTEAQLGSNKSFTYRFKASTGPKMFIIVTVDEFNVINGMFINLSSSGTTLHNVVNALGRIISLSIQEIRKIKSGELINFLLKIVSNMEGVSSESVWISNSLGKANSIPDCIALVLLRQLEVEEKVDDLHNGEEE